MTRQNLPKAKAVGGPRIDWAGLLHHQDPESLWNALFNLVKRHPATRPLHFTDMTTVSSDLDINADLAQELFLELLRKNRFNHYLANNYSSSEIENELTHVELPNLIGSKLRKRYPESFRMARRVSSLLKTSRAFRRSGKDSIEAAGPKPRGRRMVDQMYSLRQWPATKPAHDAGHFVELARSVAIRQRDIQVVGRSRSSQLIISNRALEDLIVEIFKAIDSPADVRTIRQLVLSKISVQDCSVASLDDVANKLDGDTRNPSRPASGRRSVSMALIVDLTPSPEDQLLRREHSESVRCLASDFLRVLRRAVNNNPQRYGRVLDTLWHCYFNPNEPSQIEMAQFLGVSDSLVSSNRKLIERQLRTLGLSLEDGPLFSEELRRLVTPRKPGSPLIYSSPIIAFPLGDSSACSV
ncbi:MAG TPA: hypothetical protein VI756_06365 [Blastocatellia bacterium]